MRTTQFAADNFYHVLNRGVDKRQIFIDEHDFLRFYVSLFAFNDEQYIARLIGGLDVSGILKSHVPTVSHGRDVGLIQSVDSRKRLVDVVAFCLMKNHFHFLLRPRIENGISLFMKRLTQGYASYFNLRYERSGALFQGRFRAVLIDRDAQLVHVPRYIHLNALDGILPEWREGKIVEWTRALEILNQYRWSSHHFFMSGKQILPIVQKVIGIGDMYESPGRYEMFLKSWSTGFYKLEL